MDLAVLLAAANPLLILFGDGTGNFPSSAALVVGVGAASQRADFNLDGT
jgi:hypothetical protein